MWTLIVVHICRSQGAFGGLIFAATMDPYPSLVFFLSPVSPHFAGAWLWPWYLWTGLYNNISSWVQCTVLCCAVWQSYCCLYVQVWAGSLFYYGQLCVLHFLFFCSNTANWLRRMVPITSFTFASLLHDICQLWAHLKFIHYKAEFASRPAYLVMGKVTTIACPHGLKAEVTNINQYGPFWQQKIKWCQP